MPNWEKTTVEQLQSEVSDLEKLLNELRTKTFSDAEREKKEKDAKSKAEKLKWQIDALSKQEWIDPKLAEETEKAKVLLESYEKTLGLKNSIKDKSAEWSKTDSKESSNKPASTEKTQASTQTETESPVVEWEEKWFFWKASDWIKEQWNATTRENFKKAPWVTSLRAIWFWLTWYALVKWIKKLWNRATWKKKEKEWWDNEDKTKENSDKKEEWWEKSFWNKPVWKFIKWAWAVLWVWTGVYYVAHGLYTQNRWLNDLWDREKGKKMDFDTAMDYCKWAITNQDNKEGMWYGLDLKYHEDTWEIEAYWEKIKIDKSNRKIEWLKIDFKKYEHMINTAIVIAYLKKNYSWRCSSNSPFDLNWSWQWDINVATQEGSQEAVDWTWNWGRITWIWTAAVASIITAIRSKNIKLWASVLTAWWALWFAWWYVFDSNNIMNKHMPELDDENWRKELTAYLNRMACWESRNQMEEDITESPIKKEVVECMEEIQQTSPELPNLWGVRKIDAIQDPNNPEKYIIKVYKKEILAKVTWEPGDRKINILWIDGKNPTIKTNMEKSWLSNLNLPLKEWLYMSCLTWFLLNNYHNKWIKYPWFEYTWRTNHAFKEWIYFSGDWTDTRVYSKDAFQQKMPTLFQEENRKKYLEFLNDWITGENNVSIRKK